MIKSLEDCLLRQNVPYSVYANYLKGDSLQDILSNLCGVLQEVINEVNIYTAIVTALKEWIENNGLEDAVNKKLEEMINDGTFDTIINQKIFSELLSDITELKTKTYGMPVILNDSMSIEIINNYLLSGGMFIFKNGYYNVNVNSYIKVKSNSLVIFEPNAIIKQTDFNAGNYVMLEIHNEKNVILYEPNIDGKRTVLDSDSSVGEWGYGLEITASENIKVVRPKINNTTGDGLYIGYKWVEIENPIRTQNIEIIDPTIDYVSRNGISVCSGDNIRIYNPVITRVNRKNPKSGIDIEPENSNKDLIHLNDVRIINMKTSNNSISLAMLLEQGSKIFVDGINSFNETPFALYNNVGSDVVVNNINGFNVNNNMISIGELGDTSSTIINNINVYSKNNNNSYKPYNSVIGFNAKTTQKGELKINNLKNNCKGNNFVSATTRTYDEVINDLYENITLNDIELNSIPIDSSMLKNPILTNVSSTSNTGYYLLDVTRNNFYTNYINPVSSSPITRNIKSDLLDGDYKLYSNGTTGGHVVTVVFDSSLNVVGSSDKTIVSSNLGYLGVEFKKIGNNIFITKISK